MKYDTMKKHWDYVDDCYKGVIEIKSDSKVEKYLPKFPVEARNHAKHPQYTLRCWAADCIILCIISYLAELAISFFKGIRKLTATILTTTAFDCGAYFRTRKTSFPIDYWFHNHRFLSGLKYLTAAPCALGAD